MASSKSAAKSKSSGTRGAGFEQQSKASDHHLTDHGNNWSESGHEIPIQDTEKPSFYQNGDEQTATDKDIAVTLLLTGGHEYQLVLAQDSSPLKQLFSVLMDSPEKRCGRLFQLPVRSDRSDSEVLSRSEAALCFTGDRLIGIVTDPPIYIQQPTPSTTQPSSESSLISVSQTRQPSIPVTNPSASNQYAVVVSPERESDLAAGVIPSRYIQLTNFLDSELHRRVLDYAVMQEPSFVGSSTSTGDLDYRQSSVLHHFPEFADIMRGEIHQAFADVIAALKLNSFNITEVEAQLTAHNDGHYYKVHNDNGSEDTATRVLTYVYYFYQDPKPFAGGSLRIYDSRIQNNFYVQSDTFQDVTPINNSIVFFPSHYMHEVLPIICPSRQFADSRFTINGWVRQ